MKFILLINLRSGADMARVNALQDDEIRQIWSLQKQAVIRAMHLRADVPGVVCEMECESIDEVKQAMASLPFQREALNEYTVITLKPYVGTKSYLASRQPFAQRNQGYCEISFQDITLTNWLAKPVALYEQAFG